MVCGIVTSGDLCVSVVPELALVQLHVRRLRDAVLMTFSADCPDSRMCRRHATFSVEQLGASSTSRCFHRSSSA